MPSGVYTRTKEHGAKIAVANKGKCGLSGKDHPHYKEDRSISSSCAKGYPLAFYDMIPLILERDEHRCTICWVTEEDLGRRPDIHHKDEDRTNNSEENLITKCSSCHKKIPHKKKDKK